MEILLVKMRKKRYGLILHVGISKIMIIVLLLYIFLQMISCHRGEPILTNYNDTDSAILDFQQNRVKINIDSLYQDQKEQFENNYWYIYSYKCGREDAKYIGKELDTIVFYFSSDSFLYNDNKKIGTWNLKKINQKLIWMNLKIEDSIEKIYLPSMDYWFTYSQNNIFILNTLHGTSEEDALIYRISLKKGNYPALQITP